MVDDEYAGGVVVILRYFSLAAACPQGQQLQGCRVAGIFPLDAPPFLTPVRVRTGGG